MPLTDQRLAELDRLASFDPGPYPVVSLYLNLRPNDRGRDNFEPYVRKEFGERLRAYGAAALERESLEADAEKIRAHVATIPPSADGLALFASSGADFFEAVTLDAPVDEHRLYIADRPHLYPLAHALDAYPRFAVLVADTRSARLLVVAGRTMRQAAQIDGVKTHRHKMGGWAQARYQRHIDNFHAQHAKEVADRLTHVVRDEGIESVVVSASEPILSLLKEHLPKEISERIVDVLALDAHVPERELLDATIAAMRQKDAETDREQVDALLDAYRASSLATVGLDNTRKALELGQVDQLVITARLPEEDVANELVVKARQTSASTRFIEDAALLEAVEGVGAFLRFKL
jgi:peptide subunit release factor 1 (eRF1)